VVTGYTTRKVANLVGLAPDRVRAFARAGLLTATRDARGWYRYSIQDVVLLRTAKGLKDAYVSPRKIWMSLRKLKNALPCGRPLSTVRVLVHDTNVLVQDRESLWHSESGQLELDLSMSDLTKGIEPLVKRAAAAVRNQKDGTSDDWFRMGLDFELVHDTEQAKMAYRQALSLNPDHAGAHVNLGRRLHDEGRIKDAEQHYLAALERMPNHINALVYLAHALEERKQFDDAIAAYKKALRIDPDFADAHYHLARLYEREGRQQSALRHVARYQSLVEAKTET
jgi:tetratricopeptide (TPR) repeat protein